MTITRERAIMLGVWGAAALSCVLGAAAPPAAADHATIGRQALDLVRAGSAAALALTLLLGPGLLWRALSRRRLRLAFVPLPGLLLLCVLAGGVWLMADGLGARTASDVLVLPLLGLLLGGLLGAGPEDLLDGEEQRVLAVMCLALGLAIARSLWSLGPVGELYEGTISRNLVSEPRPDSRIPFIVTELIGNGEAPYGSAGASLFLPYNFSSRGPLAGMASAPVVLSSGGSPPLSAPEAPWLPFDHEGVMAFRIAMILYSSTILLSLWQLARRLGGRRAAWLALLLGATTPFFYSDLWFTWPKLLAASFVLLAGIGVVERRTFRAGLAVGVGYLMHPSALLGLFGLAPLSLWRPLGARIWRPDLLAGARLAAGTAVCLVGWRLVNGSHFMQSGFLDYVKQAYPHYHPTVGQWLEFRFATLADTLVPLFLPIVHGDSVSINRLFGTSPEAVHYFFQYWTGVPFGFAIVFFPLLLVSLWRAGRRWPWAVTAAVVVPFLAFWIYWGASVTGLLREGMQAWVFVVLAVVAVEQAAAGFPWLRSRGIRAILALRGVEVFVATVGATLATRSMRPIGSAFKLSDTVAIVAIAAISAALVAIVWRETAAFDEQPVADTAADNPRTASNSGRISTRI
jgi:hypothetical protein